MKITVMTPLGKYEGSETEGTDDPAVRERFEKQLLATIQNRGAYVLAQTDGFTFIPLAVMQQSIVDVEW